MDYDDVHFATGYKQTRSCSGKRKGPSFVPTGNWSLMIFEKLYVLLNLILKLA
jgi:hypothetical protein